MIEFFSTTFGLITVIGGVIAVSVVGVTYIFGLFKKNKDGADDRLINILKSTVDELEIKVNKQTVDIEKLTKKVDELEKENKTLIQVLQGKDEQTQKFYEEGFKAMKNAAEILTIVKDTQGLVKDKNGLIDKLLDVVKENPKVILEAARL